MSERSTPIIGITSHSIDETLPRSAIVQLYVDAITAAGGAPIAIPIGLKGDSLRSIYRALDGLLLPGGDDVAPALYGQESHPQLSKIDVERDEVEIQLARWALEENLPVLGICRGIQVLAVAAGGTLYQDIPSELSSELNHWARGAPREHLAHPVAIASSSKLAEAVGRTSTLVNSFHHQAVRDVPERFTVTARSEDGVIEAIEAPEHPFAVGVQCHPECIWDTSAPEFASLFTAFVRTAGANSTAGKSVA